MMNSLILKTGSTADLSIGLTSLSIQKSKGFSLVLSTDGHVFWPINDYLIYRYITLKRDFGTVNGDASSLSLFVRYLGINKIQLKSMNDTLFVEYRDFLVMDHEKGKATQVNKNLHAVRNFLMWYDNKIRMITHSKRRIISYSTEEKRIDAQINIYVTTKPAKKKNGKPYTITYYHHAAYIPNSEPNIRHPIANETVDRIWAAIPKAFTSLARRQRGELTLLLFEHLGARRSEIFLITIPDCMKAIKTGRIILTTLKGDPGRTREMEIPSVLKNRLEQYITLVRKPIVKKAIKIGRIPRDHEFLLITYVGKPWKKKSFNRDCNHFCVTV